MKRGQCVFRVISTTTDAEPGNGPGRTDRPEVSQCDLAAVVGGECACGSAGEGVEQDSECEREDPLCDPDGEPGGCFREVPLEPHLAFEVGEDALDDQSQRGECVLAAEGGGGAGAVGV
jgi:hypothetical protein